MRIAFDAKRAFYNNTGLGNYSRNTIRQLGTFFPENEYLLFTPSDSKSIKFEKPVNSKIITPSTFSGALLKSLWRSYFMTGQILDEKPDLYHGLSNEIPYGIYKTKVKSIVTIHDLIFLRYPELYKAADRKIYDKKFRYACENADLVITVSKQTANDVMEFYQIPESKIRVVYQGCNPLFFKHIGDIQKEEIKKKYKLPEDFLLCIGTIEERKNLLGIVKAIHENKIDLPLIAIGRKTAYFQKISEYISQHSIENKFIFLENLSNTELPAFYQMAKLFIYPSIFEGFGIPILESLASGTPVITSKGSCFPEAGGPHSIYVDPNKTESIGEGINKALFSKDLRVNMILEGKKYANQFTEENVAKNLMKTYEELV